MSPYYHSGFYSSLEMHVNKAKNITAEIINIREQSHTILIFIQY